MGICLLQQMVAFQLLLAAGKSPGKGLLNIWHRVPLPSPIDGEGLKLTWVLLTPAAEFSVVQQLPSGRFQFIQFAGITEQEAAFAQANSGKGELLRLLVAHGASPVTNLSRNSIVLARSAATIPHMVS
jgi:Suppressor of fused protein (SUFU)